MATTKMPLKLLIDKKGNRVLSAEAGKEFVDFLFSLLSFPVGSVIRLLTKNKMVGCIGNLYQSVESLDEKYILSPDKNKEILLKPKTASANLLDVPLLKPSGSSVNLGTYYTCGNAAPVSPVSPFKTTAPLFKTTAPFSPFGFSDRHYVTIAPNTRCPSCNNIMNTQLTYLASETGEAASSNREKGYVKEFVTYMVMDDLIVTPMSTISSITVLNKFNVENVNLLEEKVIDFGMEEGLELLKISLQSKTALTDVFLRMKRN